MRCFVGGHINGSDQESYTTFQSCAEHSSSFAGVVKFEVCQPTCHCRCPTVADVRSSRSQFLMLLLFVVSFSFATKRKKKLLAVQHHRIASYLSH